MRSPFLLSIPSPAPSIPHAPHAAMADHCSILPLPEGAPEQQAGHQQDNNDESEVFTPLVLQSFRVEMEEALMSHLLPMARDISQGIQVLQAQAQEAANESRNELQDAQNEVQRLSSLILSFQQAVSSVLPFQ